MAERKPTTHFSVFEALPGAKKPSRTVACGAGLSPKLFGYQEEWSKRLSDDPTEVTCRKRKDLVVFKDAMEALEKAADAKAP